METAESASTKYRLSRRGAENLVHGDYWAPIERALENAWDKDRNPGGIVNLGIAENSLMHEEMSNYLQKNFEVKSQLHLTYGTGPRGSHRLRKAVSSLFNSHFHAREPVTADQILPISGVGPLTDALTWCICSDGEGILLPQPLYTGFQVDIPQRSRGVIVPVPFSAVDGYRDLNDVFDARINELAFEQALQESEKKGVKIRAVLVTNPHNPLGKCYPIDTLKTIAHSAGGIISTCYAMRSTHFLRRISVQMVYDWVYYVRRMKGLIGAVASLSVFAWPPYVLQDLWAKMLEDRSYLDWFLAKNKRRLSENYTLLTSFLSSHGIKYFTGSNAGVFVWVDLREYISSLTEETLIVKRCTAHGVFVGYGSNFFSEEIGWFRITFTAKPQALIEGLERLVNVLKDIKAARGREEFLRIDFDCIQ